ncbi:hypothetical protein EDC56_1518 [Sinobacterium caligoides]|uniref:Uncharacterized protein n=1 Tax=Sinobacterium caligoides TaxID=933926 RepID=A0A3N2DMQ7_9GAMM|nr:hypothetical protein EDC56_1518 [Sinobacterium caligoides]
MLEYESIYKGALNNVSSEMKEAKARRDEAGFNNVRERVVGVLSDSKSSDRKSYEAYKHLLDVKF